MITGSVPQHTISTIDYFPGIQTTGDKETGTKTITATTEAVGVGNADYNHALTLATPSDSRLVVDCIGSRLTFTIASFDTATILYCRVYVDAQDANHLLFDTSHNAVSQKLISTHCSTIQSTRAVIHALLADGAAHTFYFFFWVNQANNAVINEVTLTEMVGSDDNSGAPIMTLTYNGLVTISAARGVSGTGNCTFRYCAKAAANTTAYVTHRGLQGYAAAATDTAVNASIQQVSGYTGFFSYSSVTTDVAGILGIRLVLGV